MSSVDMTISVSFHISVVRIAALDIYIFFVILQKYSRALNRWTYERTKFETEPFSVY